MTHSIAAIAAIVALLLSLGFLLWERQRLKDRIRAVESRLTRVRRKFDWLSAQQRFLEQILNAISDPIFVKDAQHRFIFVNDAQCRLSGRARWEVLGRTDEELFPKRRADVSSRADDRVLASGEEDINEEQIADIAGARRTIITKKTRYVDGQGRRYIVGISRDAAGTGRVPERAESAPPRSRRQAEAAESIRIGAAPQRHDDAARVAPAP